MGDNGGHSGRDGSGAATQRVGRGVLQEDAHVIHGKITTETSCLWLIGRPLGAARS